MDTKLLLEFVIFSMLNVIIQTAKGIITIKGGKLRRLPQMLLLTVFILTSLC